MEKSRFEVAKASKFETLTNEDLKSVKGGGICIKCMKVSTKKWSISIGTVTNKDVPMKSSYSTNDAFVGSVDKNLNT